MENSGSLKIIDYSEKAIAVIGETKQIKDVLKNAGGRFNSKLSCGPGWIFSKRSYNKIAELMGEKLEGKNFEKIEKSSDKDYIFRKTLEEVISIAGDGGYYRKAYIGAVKLSNGLYYLLEKPKIKKDFYLCDEGEEFELYASLCENEGKLADYFVHKNTAVYNSRMKFIESGEYSVSTSAQLSGSIKTCYIYFGRGSRFNSNIERSISLTPEEIQSLIDGIGFQLRSISERCEKYLRRFGVSKLWVNSYWADR